jgi:hypothetical protein
VSVVGSVYRHAEGDTERFAVIVATEALGYVAAVILTPANRIAPVARLVFCARDRFDSEWEPVEVEEAPVEDARV